MCWWSRSVDVLLMVGMSWEHSMGRISCPHPLTRADSIIWSTQFLILNVYLKVFSFSIWSFQCNLPCPSLARIFSWGWTLRFALLRSHWGCVCLWTSLQVPRPQALLSRSVLVSKAEGSMFHVDFWLPSFVGLLPTHSIPGFFLWFCCVCSFPLKTRKKV